MHNAILKMLENNSRIDLHDLAVMMGTDEAVIVEEIEKMEKDGVILIGKGRGSKYVLNYKI